MQELAHSTQLATVSGVSLDTIAAAYIKQLDVRMSSSKKTYTRVLRLFVQWVHDTGREFSRMSKIDIMAYKDDLKLEKAPYTVSSYMGVVKAFYEWLDSEGLYKNIAKGVKVPEKVSHFKRDYLTAQQAQELLEDVALNGSLRDQALVNLLLRTGIRTIEASRARVADIQQRAGHTVLYVQGKGHEEKDCFVIISDKCNKILQQYLDSRGATRPEDPLFVCMSNFKAKEKNHTAEGKSFSKLQLSTTSISAIVRRHLDNIGLTTRQYTAHSLRHTCACLMLEQHVPTEFVQMTLRHASPETTQMYTYHVEEHRRLELAAESVLDNIF